MLRQIGAAVTGEDPAHIERLWHKMFRSFTYMGSRGAAVECVSAIDIALWDIRGKVLGKPIYELLGGPVRDEIALYTHPDQRKFTSKEGVVAEIRDIVEVRPHRAQVRSLPPPGPQRRWPGPRAARRLPRRQHDPQGRARGGRTDRADPRDGRARHRHPHRCAWPLRRSHRHPALPHASRRPARSTGSRSPARPRASTPSSRCARRSAPRSRGASAATPSGISCRSSRTSSPTTSCRTSPGPAASPSSRRSRPCARPTTSRSRRTTPRARSTSSPGAQVMMTVPNFYKLETSEWNLRKYDQLIDKPLDNSNGSLKLDVEAWPRHRDEPRLPAGPRDRAGLATLYAGPACGRRARRPERG